MFPRYQPKPTCILLAAAASLILGVVLLIFTAVQLRLSRNS